MIDPRRLVIGPDDPFPAFDVAVRSDEGWLRAVSGDVTASMLERAYPEGIFPWYAPGEPVLWWFTEPRMVLPVKDFRVSRSLRKTLRQASDGCFAGRGCEVRFDMDFEAVIRACASIARPGQDGTWITDEVIEAYTGLHRLGKAHCVALASEDGLLGGLYGVAIGRMFYGESMFSRAPNASKTALAALVSFLDAQGAEAIDCQQVTRHLTSLGGKAMDRAAFLALLARRCKEPPMDWGSVQGEATRLLGVY